MRNGSVIGNLWKSVLLIHIVFFMYGMAGYGQEAGSAARADIFFSGFTDARLASCNRACVFVSTKRYYLLKNFNEHSLLAALPVKRGVFAVSAWEAGLSAMKNQQLSLHYGMKLLPELDAGVRLVWSREVFQETRYPDNDRYSFSISMQTSLKQRLILGFSIDNPLVFPDDKGGSGLLPVIRFYGEKSLGSGISILLGLHQKKGTGICSTAGVRMQKKNVVMSAGMQVHPGSLYFSAGWRIRGMVISLKSSWHPVLGFSPETLFYAEKGRRP